MLALTFIPFLVFFMLSWQDHVRSQTVMLFSMENRNSAYVMLGLIARMIRSFILGNFIIGVFLSICSIAIFGVMGLPYFYFLGVISGFLSLIPYLGVMFAVLPPLVADLGHLTTGICRAGDWVDSWPAPGRNERALPEDPGQASATESPGRDPGAAVLGMVVGRDGTDSRGAASRAHSRSSATTSNGCGRMGRGWANSRFWLTSPLPSSPLFTFDNTVFVTFQKSADPAEEREAAGEEQPSRMAHRLSLR